jgi:acetylornithine/succinyldiaminopimelate/putrescine aminotransferase
MLTAAKPIGGGIPLGAVLANEKFVSTIKPGDHGTTFGGNPLACALGNTVFSIVGNEKFLDCVAQKGEYLKQKLSEIQKTQGRIIGIFGRGLLIGVQLNFEPKKVVIKAREKGLLLGKSEKNMVRFIPPLIISNDELDEALKIFVSVLDELNN